MAHSHTSKQWPPFYLLTFYKATITKAVFNDPSHMKTTTGQTGKIYDTLSKPYTGADTIRLKRFLSQLLPYENVPLWRAMLPKKESRTAEILVWVPRFQYRPETCITRDLIHYIPFVLVMKIYYIMIFIIYPGLGEKNTTTGPWSIKMREKPSMKQQQAPFQIKGKPIYENAGEKHAKHNMNKPS